MGNITSANIKSELIDRYMAEQDEFSPKNFRLQGLPNKSKLETSTLIRASGIRELIFLDIMLVDRGVGGMDQPYRKRIMDGNDRLFALKRMDYLWNALNYHLYWFCYIHNTIPSQCDYVFVERVTDLRVPAKTVGAEMVHWMYCDRRNHGREHMQPDYPELWEDYMATAKKWSKIPRYCDNSGCDNEIPLISPNVGFCFYHWQHFNLKKEDANAKN